MYAVIETGGKQFRVSLGDVIEVDRLPWPVGTEIELNRVLAVFQEPDQLLAGPEVGDAKVRATITEHDRAKKIIVFKFKRKKQYKRTIGHRQDLTRVKVTEIVTA
ncbi:MAG: 50S ribosomal protein L21 [Acidobacteria bacterium]|nr:50S ribosomal protein L21 [Acidobacteriota bacterium]